MNKRDIKLDQYNISKFAYRELSNFCLQYPEKKQKLNELRNPLQCQSYSDMPHGSTVGDPTGRQAEQCAKLSRDTELIEQVAIEALPDAYQELIKNVTENIPFKTCKYVNWTVFRFGRHKFFYLLFKKTLDKDVVNPYI